MLKLEKFSISLFIYIILGTVLMACEPNVEESVQSKKGNDEVNSDFKRTTLNIEEEHSNFNFSVEFDYPFGWKTERIRSNLFYASQKPDLVTDGFANNFHTIIYKDSMKVDIGTYNINFLLNEQQKMPNMSFHLFHSEIIKNRNEITFQLNQTKIWSSTQDTLFSISAVAKINDKIIHLNFYSNFEEKKDFKVLAENVIESVKITE